MATLVAIVGSKVEANVTLYRIMVREAGQERVVQRRYNDFLELDRALRIHSWLLRGSLPPKRPTWLVTRDFQEQRQQHLDEYLVSIVQQAQPLDRIPELRQFLSSAKPPANASAKRFLADATSTNGTALTGCESVEDRSTSSNSSSAAHQAGESLAPRNGVLNGDRHDLLQLGDEALAQSTTSSNAVDIPFKNPAGSLGCNSDSLRGAWARGGHGSVRSAAGSMRRPGAAQTQKDSRFSLKCCFTGIGTVAVLICLGQVLPESAPEIFGETD